MNFNDPDFRLANGLFIVATVGLATGLIGLVVLQTGHGPSTSGISSSAKKTQQTTTGKILDAKDAKAKAQADLETMVWKAPTQEVTAKTLNSVSELSKQNKLTLLSFRPLRQVETPQVTQLPWQVVVDGSYKGVLAFERALEASERKLAVTLVQVTAADATTDRVTATIGLLAFAAPAPNPATSDDTTPNSDRKNEKNGVKNG